MNRDDFSLSILFEQPFEISAYGLRSANNFPHLDPKEVRIYVRIDGEDEFYETNHIENVDFKNRYQTKNYIKLSPWEMVKEVKFQFYKQDM